MGKPTGFMEYGRKTGSDRNARERLRDWSEFHELPTDNELKTQGARCMDCGVPFCHEGKLMTGGTSGCPINNLIPEWNDLVYRGKWKEAYDRLAMTNNFPEFTGRVCPAPCEGSCVLGITSPAVTIKNIERAIIDKAFEEGWVKPRIPRYRSGYEVAVVGSGPAGLACADQLNQLGHEVTVYEKSDRLGGLLMYGIPNMKLEKEVVERRIKLLEDEGIEFRTGSNIDDEKLNSLMEEHDSVVLCLGAEKPRDLGIEGRDLDGIHFAMDYLTQSTKSVLGDSIDRIDAKGKDVIVIGGGDTGTDCVGTAMRQGCRSLIQFEITDKPPLNRDPSNPWPQWPKIYKLDYGQEEAAAVFGRDPRRYQLMSQKFVGNESGQLTGIETVEVELKNGRIETVSNSTRLRKADLALLAVGFTGVNGSWLSNLDIHIDERTNVRANNKDYMTSRPGVFVAGDARRGQSLIVWAIREGREAAESCHRFLAK